jgi:hypothetical protein
VFDTGTLVAESGPRPQCLSNAKSMQFVDLPQGPAFRPQRRRQQVPSPIASCTRQRGAEAMCCTCSSEPCPAHRHHGDVWHPSCVPGSMASPDDLAAASPIVTEFLVGAQLRQQSQLCQAEFPPESRATLLPILSRMCDALWHVPLRTAWPRDLGRMTRGPISSCASTVRRSLRNGLSC